MVPYQPNQLHPELMSISSLLPFDGSISSSRKQMAGNALSQTLVIKNPSERYIQTDVDREFGKYTFNVKVKSDSRVIKVIDRYPRTINADSIRENPEMVVIYEDHDTKQVGCIILNRHFSQHPHFGFRYKVKETPNGQTGWDGLRSWLSGRPALNAGTVLMDSPAVNEHGGYMFGKEVNVAFLTLPGVAEDGMIMSNEIMEDFSHTTTEHRIVEFGSKSFPMNTYGTDEEFKPFPNIGEYVREDGLLMVLRSYEDNLSPVEQSRKGVGVDRIDQRFDDRVYVAPGRGRVVDIRVMHDPSSVMPCTPAEMCKQAAKYDDATKRYYEQILQEYHRLQARPEKVEITKEFSRLIEEAYGVVGLGRAIMRNGRPINDSLIKQYRKAPLDDWRLVFTIEYENLPKEGNKFSDLVGGFL